MLKRFNKQDFFITLLVLMLTLYSINSYYNNSNRIYESASKSLNKKYASEITDCTQHKSSELEECINVIKRQLKIEINQFDTSEK